MNGAAGRPDGRPSFPVNSPLFLLPVVALGRGRLGHVDRIGGWEGALQPRFERPFEALATLVLVVLTSLPIADLLSLRPGRRAFEGDNAQDATAVPRAPGGFMIRMSPWPWAQ